MSVIGFPTTLSTAHHSARAYPDAAAWLAERRTQDKAVRTLDRDERVTAALLNRHPEHALEDFTRDDLMAFFACRPGGGRLSRDRPMSESALRDWHRKRQAEAKIPYRNFHATRHTMATYFLRRGISMQSVQASLGHESIKTTIDLYAHLVPEDFAKELAALGL